MIQPLALLVTAALLMSVISAQAADKTQRTLTGRITGEGDHPLAEVRVALKTAKVVTQTNADGQFTLDFVSDYPSALDKGKAYDALDLDKEGYIGQTIDIKDLSYFDKPVAEKLKPTLVTEDKVEYSRRMSMGHVFPNGSAELPKFDAQSPDISAADWKRFFDAMDNHKADAPEERVNVQAYIPRAATKLKAMFLLTRHGIGSVDQPRLRDFAERHSIALVGLLGNPVQRGFYPVSVIDEDIKKIGGLLHHPELSSVPILSFGHSNGTGFAGIFASQLPDKVIAWISYHSGTAFHLQLPGVEKVPGLAMHGQIDPFSKNGQEQTIMNLRAKRNAPIALMMEGNVAHGPVDKDQKATWDFVIQFCEAAMRIRLNEDGTLKPVVIEQGWLGANYDRAKGGQQDLDIAPFADFKGDRSIANWLPDKQFAEVWQHYAKTDPRPVK